VDHDRDRDRDYVRAHVHVRVHDYGHDRVRDRVHDCARDHLLRREFNDDGLPFLQSFCLLNYLNLLNLSIFMSLVFQVHVNVRGYVHDHDHDCVHVHGYDHAHDRDRDHVLLHRDHVHNYGHRGVCIQT
jgi:hypothetical protein